MRHESEYSVPPIFYRNRFNMRRNVNSADYPQLAVQKAAQNTRLLVMIVYSKPFFIFIAMFCVRAYVEGK